MSDSLRGWVRGTIAAATILFVIVSGIDSFAYSPDRASLKHEAGSFVGTTPTSGELVAAAERMGMSASSVSSLSKQASSIDNSGVSTRFNGTGGTPFFIDSDGMSHLTAGNKPAVGATPYETALGFIETHASVFLLDFPQDELVLKDIVSDNDGTTHVRFRQIYQGLPVDGQELVVHLDASGVPYAFNGRYSPTPQEIDVNSSGMSSDEAVGIVIADISVTASVQTLKEPFRSLLKYDGPVTARVIRVDDENGKAHLSWRVDIRPDERNFWRYYIDALDGSVIDKFNMSPSQTSATATAVDGLGVQRTFNVSLENSVYSMHDMEAAIYTYDAHGKVVGQTNTPTLVTSGNNTWTDASAVSAHSNLREVYDYYLSVHGRKGIDGNGGDMPAVIHYTEDGKLMDNAFWNGQFIAFGDAQPYATALDVAGHELTHGVVQYTAGLEYKYQSGALNESMADVMAIFIDPDWEIAEDLPNGPIRDVSNPHRFNLPENMSEYKNYSLNQDYGGVHVNMSIPSRAAYLTAQAIGRDKTAQIWYRVLKNLYLTPKSQFVDMRLGAIRAAKDLFGDDSTEAAAVTSAFDTVGIVGDTPSELPTDIPALVGENLIAYVYMSGQTALLAISPPDMTSSNDVIFPTRTPLSVDGSSPVTVSKGGAFCMFIDASGNIRKLDLESGAETVVFDSGQWSSIKLSPDASKLAATTVNADSSIYMFDLVNPENSRSIPLYTPSTEGVETKTALYADALDWDSTSTQLIYDSFHSLPVVGGTPLEFWDINIMDVASGIISRVKTPADDGSQIGNPSFAETNDRYIVCDRFNEDQGTSEMVTVDLYTLDMTILLDTGMISTAVPNLGHPKYSPDDSKIIFQQYSFRYNADVLYTIPLNADKMTASGSPKSYYYGSYADWFVRGDATGVSDEESNPMPTSVIMLYPNYPNPFNPVTHIPFTLSAPGHVTLVVYDVLGRETARLVDKPMSAGSHSVAFDGSGLASGLYFYRLESNGVTKTGRMSLVK